MVLEKAQFVSKANSIFSKEDKKWMVDNAPNYTVLEMVDYMINSRGVKGATKNNVRSITAFHKAKHKKGSMANYTAEKRIPKKIKEGEFFNIDNYKHLIF